MDFAAASTHHIAVGGNDSRSCSLLLTNSLNTSGGGIAKRDVHSRGAKLNAKYKQRTTSKVCDILPASN
eukprot:6212366-Pleurochrysis_carterae.AAC.2